jgi:hypothetical protein
MLAAAGGTILVLSAINSWVQPARVAWPSYTDGVPDFISHPSDLTFRLGAALLGVCAIAVVAAARRSNTSRLPFLAIALLGVAGLAVGLVGFASVEHDRGFGSIIANDMTITGFRHGLLNYAELAGAALLLVSPLAATSPARPSGGAAPRRGPRL